MRGTLLKMYLLYSRVFVGVKKLLALIDMAKQTPENMRVVKFLTKLEEEGGLITPSSMQ
jgi:hypothetical protein